MTASIFRIAKNSSSNALVRANELEYFKTAINLTEYAAGQGYLLDRRASSRNSVVMRHPGGDKDRHRPGRGPALDLLLGAR